MGVDVEPNFRVLSFNGVVLKLKPIEQKTNLVKQEFIIETSEKYPQKFLIEAVNEMVPYASVLSIGAKVCVKVTVKGAMRYERNYVNLIATAIELT